MALPNQPTNLLSFLRDMYFADLKAARVYASVSSLIWAAIIASTDHLFDTFSWSFLRPIAPQGTFALGLFCISIAQLALANSPINKVVQYIDAIIHALYAAIWIYCVLNIANIAMYDEVSKMLLANHLMLAILGFWIVSRGFWIYKPQE